MAVPEGPFTSADVGGLPIATERRLGCPQGHSNRTGHPNPNWAIRGEAQGLVRALGARTKCSEGVGLSDLPRRVVDHGTSAWVHGRERPLLANDPRPGAGKTEYDDELPGNADLARSV